jgi:hypothetical protein
MDFNTGRDSGRSEDRPLYGEETGGPTGRPPRGPAGSPGGEFNLSDPVNSFINTVRAVVLDPAGFFRGIARRGDFINPLVFALICYEIFAILSGLLALVGIYGNQGVGGFIISLILTPIFAAVGLFIGAGILHLFVLLFVRPSNAGFEATFRVSSYTSVTALVSWIPIIGFIASLYGLYIAIMGIREVHATTTGRAALVVLVPAVVVLFLLLILVLLIGVALFVGSQQQL